MKEAVIAKGPTVQIIDSPIPEPNDLQVLIRVVVSGSNPKDWKLPNLLRPDVVMNQGDDIAGVVERVGQRVFEFRPGDRVAAFHEMMTPHGSYAEYAIAWAHTTFHIPHETTFEEAAAIPLAAMTAALGLYQRLGLPQPFPQQQTSHHHDIPLVIYGAASAVGIYALQLALRSNIHPIICVVGRAREYVEGFIDRSKGDALVDYREGDEAVVRGIKAALRGRELMHALDAVSEKGSPQNLGRVLAKGGKVTFVLGGPKDELLPDHVNWSITLVGAVHREDEGSEKDFGYVYYRYMARGLQEGWFRPQRTEVVKGGLNGVQTALENLRDGKASGVKYVFRIGETEGATAQ
ncbi:alcohol dehydrogenase-like protein [Diplogelasinospora grovesii]|uniref:Alcohol dehydrogenase-like protein n=1 Tax=Diplogelasinospora grovesii TaxID=303347 RepID=A0AAN6S4L5_9PEZI|nr:alcohol dehydrogenase-like protein [Diplogelasinospora grovesii]